MAAVLLPQADRKNGQQMAIINILTLDDLSIVSWTEELGSRDARGNENRNKDKQEGEFQRNQN